MLRQDEGKVKQRDHQQHPDNDIHHFHALLDMIDRPVDTNDYNVPQVKQKPVEPTMSVVELPKPHLAPQPQLEEIHVELHHQPNEDDNKEEILVSPMPDDDCSAEEFTMHPTVSRRHRTIIVKTCFPENTGSRQEDGADRECSRCT